MTAKVSLIRDFLRLLCQSIRLHMSITSFNPNSAALHDSGLFGLPFDEHHSQIIIIPIEWELTVSYGKGTAAGPKAVYDASLQIDLNNHDYPDLWKKGIWMDSFPEHLRQLHDSLRKDADTIIQAIGEGSMDENDKKFITLYQRIEEGAERMNQWLFERIAYWKSKGKIVGLLGGDHSVPIAYHRYLNDQKSDYGVLMVDAHIDLRDAYEGFKYSHASIFFNVMKMSKVKKLVQVGIRDYCHEEAELVRQQSDRVHVFFDRDLRMQQFEGIGWKEQVDSMIGLLPDKVYISVDIDGLDPVLCPNTGTPVPGGLQFEELMYLLNRIRLSGKDIIGFDLCEVSPGHNEWDGNVGARVLFQLCGVASK